MSFGHPWLGIGPCDSQVLFISVNACSSPNETSHIQCRLFFDAPVATPMANQKRCVGPIV